jgi:hypothetical protein
MKPAMNPVMLARVTFDSRIARVVMRIVMSGVPPIRTPAMPALVCSSP